MTSNEAFNFNIVVAEVLGDAIDAGGVRHENLLDLSNQLRFVSMGYIINSAVDEYEAAVTEDEELSPHLRVAMLDHFVSAQVAAIRDGGNDE